MIPAIRWQFSFGSPRTSLVIQDPAGVLQSRVELLRIVGFSFSFSLGFSFSSSLGFSFSFSSVSVSVSVSVAVSARFQFQFQFRLQFQFQFRFQFQFQFQFSFSFSFGCSFSFRFSFCFSSVQFSFQCQFQFEFSFSFSFSFSLVQFRCLVFSWAPLGGEWGEGRCVVEIFYISVSLDTHTSRHHWGVIVPLGARHVSRPSRHRSIGPGVTTLGSIVLDDCQWAESGKCGPILMMMPDTCFPRD